MQNKNTAQTLKTDFKNTINQYISLQKINEIPVIVVDHPKNKAIISLQGAHLISWQPHTEEHNVLWLSEIEPFKLQSALRGGIPVCYPWFNNAGTPAHGYARISLWQLTNWHTDKEQVELSFVLFDKQQLPESELKFTFTDECKIHFTHFGEDTAQVALHSYFNISDIKQVELQDMPTHCYNFLTSKEETIASPRLISQHTDCIYSNAHHSVIQDNVWNRALSITHNDSSDVVVWNPWYTKTSKMSEDGFKTMLCVESARINKKLHQGESITTILKLITTK